MTAPGRQLEVRAAAGFGGELAEAVPIPLGRGLAGRVAASRTPQLIDDLDQVELVSPHLRLRGIRSLVAVPLLAEGDALGVLHVGSLEPAHFSPADVRLLELVGDRIALAINQASLYEAERSARLAAQQAQERLAFLAEASEVLGSSLDYDATLGSLARLAVPRLADWCAIDVLAADGEVERVAVAHVDPAKVALAEDLHRRYPPRPRRRAGRARRPPQRQADARAGDPDRSSSPRASPTGRSTWRRCSGSGSAR